MAEFHRRALAFTANGHTRNDEAGVTLIEILVALGILAAVAIAFISGMETTSMAVLTSQERLAMESLAKSQMEYIKSQDYIFVTDVSQYDLIDIPADLAGQGYDIDVDKDNLLDAYGNIRENIQQVTVTVTRTATNVFRMRTGEVTSFTLVDYKVQR